MWWCDFNSHWPDIKYTLLFAILFKLKSKELYYIDEKYSLDDEKSLPSDFPVDDFEPESPSPSISTPTKSLDVSLGQPIFIPHTMVSTDRYSYH